MSEFVRCNEGRSLARKSHDRSKRCSRMLQMMGAIVCSCPRDNLCPSCVNQALMWFSGMACSRGITWAESVARRDRSLLQRPWPAHEGRAAALARDKVADLSRDPKVIERLAMELSERAAKRWRELQQMAHQPSADRAR